ncbi:MAG: hypothetical protein AAF363_11730 [Bacteroidota bacterium]
MRLFNIFFNFFTTLLIITSCSIVSVDPVDEEVTVEAVEEPTEAEGINTGSGEVPLDSTTFMNLLTGGDSKTFSADDFLLEGMGISFEQSCRLDDLITFNADGTFLYDGGDQLCGAEDDSEVREGSFSIDLSREDPFIIFTDVDGFGTSSFEGKVWTLEDSLIVISSVYTNQVFGSFEVTGRYTVN